MTLNENEPSVRTPPASHTIAPPRSQLARLVGRVVTAVATYGNQALQTDTGVWVYYISDIVVLPNTEVEHLWLQLPQHVRRKLFEGTRFTFRGEVCEYERANSSKDFGIRFDKLVSVDR